MPASISLLLSRSQASAQGSVAYVNASIAPLLLQSGWAPRSFQPRSDARSEEATLPLGLASAHALELARGPADIALYDDAGAAMRTPNRRWAQRNIVLYHGLAYGAGAWMTSPDIDLHCANSPYLARVLRAIFAFPDWQGRRCLDANPFAKVTDVVLPLPCLPDAPSRNAFTEGAEIPDAVRRLLDGTAIVGHALQSRKHDIMATLSILYGLNDLARRSGTPPVKLLLSAASLDAERRRTIDAMLAPSGFRCEDFFVPMPHLKQRALFELMRACRFCLAYNRFPEPFGFYVLESVFHGCPVYTNGVGNNRWLLPPEHGIVVDETSEMASERVESEAYRGIASRIHTDLAQPATVTAGCARGAAMIRDTWSRDAFSRSLDDALARVEQPAPAASDFDGLVVSLSPLVRQLDRSAGRCLNDYANTILGPAELATVESLLDRRCGELDGKRMQVLEEQHRLFQRGILTLTPPRDASARERHNDAGSAGTRAA